MHIIADIFSDKILLYDLLQFTIDNNNGGWKIQKETEREYMILLTKTNPV